MARGGDTDAMCPRLALSSLVSLGLAACASSPAPFVPKAELPTVDLSSEGAFTASVGRRIEAHTGTRLAVVGPLVLKVDDDRDMQINLTRAWLACGNEPESCEPEVDRLAVGLGEALAPAKTVREALVLVLRTKSYLANMGVPLSPITEPFAGELIAILMVDSPTTARSAGVGDLAELGLDSPAALALGRANIKSFAGTVQAQVRPTQPGNIGSINDNYYGSSLMLDIAGWQAVAALRSGRLVVSVPAPDVLLYKWLDTPQDLLDFEVLTDHFFHRVERPLSDQIFGFTGAGWELAPVVNDPVRKAL